LVKIFLRRLFFPTVFFSFFRVADAPEMFFFFESLPLLPSKKANTGQPHVTPHLSPFRSPHRLGPALPIPAEVHPLASPRISCLALSNSPFPSTLSSLIMAFPFSSRSQLAPLFPADTFHFRAHRNFLVFSSFSLPLLGGLRHLVGPLPLTSQAFFRLTAFFFCPPLFRQGGIFSNRVIDDILPKIRPPIIFLILELLSTFAHIAPRASFSICLLHSSLFSPPTRHDSPLDLKSASSPSLPKKVLRQGGFKDALPGRVVASLRAPPRRFSA